MEHESLGLLAFLECDPLHMEVCAIELEADVCIYGFPHSCSSSVRCIQTQVTISEIWCCTPIKFLIQKLGLLRYLLGDVEHIGVRWL
jgi:hypothetical protein